MRGLVLSMVALVLAGFVSTAMATSIAPPKDLEVESPNGKYTLKVRAKTGEHRLCEGDPDKPGQAKVLWSFKRDVWHTDYFVSNDGKHVLWVAWEFVKEDDVAKKPAIIVNSAEGEVLSRTYGQVSKPRGYKKGEVGPIADFWRIWRGKATQEGDVVTISVAGKGEFTVDLSDLSKITKEG